jgi:hypothetical protein
MVVRDFCMYMLSDNFHNSMSGQFLLDIVKIDNR